MDVDGERWVDRNGFTVWGTNGPTSFTTPKQKDIGVTMRKPKTRVIQLQKLVNAPFDVVVEIDENVAVTKFGHTTYNGKGAKTPKTNVEIKIFQRSAWRRSVNLSGKITEMESMAVNFGHEIEHLTDEAFALDAEGAPKDEREKAPDEVSEEMTQDYLNKLERIEPIFIEVTTEMQHNTIGR